MSSILVVEGDGLIAGLLEDNLGMEGYQTVEVLNGEDAIQFALRELPHLIIIDLTLPSIDGYEMIRRLRDHPKSAHIPIVVVNTHSSSADRVRAFELGVDSYIMKPFSPAEVLARVRRHLHCMQQSTLSPLTLLPGGLQLERAIERKLRSSDPWSLLYLDLDNFKAFNDVYGFLAGNAMILLVSRICQRVVHEYGNDDDFIGHVGGDDFIIVTTPDRAGVLYRHILALFKEESAALYHREDLERGSISGVDRKGRPYQFPLVSLSIGVVSGQVRASQSLDEIGPLAAEAKRNAKQSSDNVFHISSPLSNSLPELHQVAHHSTPLYKISHVRRDLFHSVTEDALAEYT